MSLRKNSEIDYTGESGEAFFSYRALKLNIRYESFGDKMPSVDGMILLRDPESGSYCWFLNVQIKTGKSFKRPLKTHKGTFSLNVKSEHTLAWNESNVPTIVVWIDDSVSPEVIYWRHAIFAKSGSSTLRMKYKNVFDLNAIPHLLNIARERAGRLKAPMIEGDLLWPVKVSDIKKEAKCFYDDWRRQNTWNPYLKKINVTLKGWRHLTERWRPQKIICSRLALLPYARKIILESSAVRHLRTIKKLESNRDIFRISGVATWKWRSRAIIDVLVERVYEADKPDKSEFSFLSVYERRNI